MPSRFALEHDQWGVGTKSLDLEWQDAILAHLDGYDRTCSPQTSAQTLREFVKKGILRFTDMKNQPERFFCAHRLLATRVLGGFGIRFTVQYNLFAGSILGLGGPEQVALLDQFQKRGELGCFALTEVGAGVLSGFIVEATATWNSERDGFVINTPTPDAEKNWISQGLVADWIVVFANLLVGGTNHGPHPFLLRMRREEDGTLLPGITVTDMGRKSVANDLDNARIRFENVFASRACLLNRFCTISPSGEYRQVGEEPMRIEVIGQRLLTGRLAIAEAALVAIRQLFYKSKEYADNKLVNGIGGKRPLSSLPHLKHIFDEAHERLARAETFTASVEARLCTHLRRGTIPDDNLVEALAVAKIRDVGIAQETMDHLEQEVGSYALMSSSGFIYKDMLLCCRFAEGDSRVLLLKIARDELKRVRKAGWFRLLWQLIFERNTYKRTRAYKAFELVRALRAAPSLLEGFDLEWKKVYALAEAVCDCHLHNNGPDAAELARMIKSHPDLLSLAIYPMHVSRL